MVMLVGLDQAKARLRFDHDAEDADLTLMIEGASAAVLNYLKGDQVFVDSFGEVESDSTGPIVPPEIQNATLMLVGILSRDRDGQESEKWQQGYLPFPVIALLYPLRTPALS